MSTTKTEVRTMNKQKVKLSPEEKAENKYNRDLVKILKRVGEFLTPIEEKWSGIGLVTLESWLWLKSNVGVICTAPMGAGKTLIAKWVFALMEQSGAADYNFIIQEFKKTDWKQILPTDANEKVFHFNVPEISVMPKYSQDFFWSNIPVLMSDGNFTYRFPSSDGEEGGAILFTDCQASFFVASQPPKTHNIINDTTFKTLANDRCVNVFNINQLRGSVNVHVRHVEDQCLKLGLKSGKFSRITLPYNKKWDFLPKECFTEKEIKGKARKFVEIPRNQVKFDNGKSKHEKLATHVTQSNLDISELEDVLRNQFSINRREEHINAVLKEWAIFLNDPVVKQIHIDVFVTLFGFYLNLFNKLTEGSVEDAIKIKYGAVEMLARISDLIARNRVVTQNLLTKEFNAEEDDVQHHVSELVRAKILSETRPVLDKPLPRSHRPKATRNVRRTTKTLKSAGLISMRRATRLDQEKDKDVKIRESVYEFTDDIHQFFKIYATILKDTLPKKVLAQIPQIEKHLNHGDDM